MTDQKNIILAIVLSAVILFGWNIFYTAYFPPPDEPVSTAQREPAPQQGVDRPELPELGTELPAVEPGTVGLPESRETALAETPRVSIDSPRLRGSIALTGARIDDLTLRDYRRTVKPSSENIVLLRPTGSARPYYSEFGWLGRDVRTPDRKSEWRADRASLAPGRPLTLSWDNGEGLRFEQVIALDENYMFSVTQRVHNSGSAPVTLYPYGLVSRTGRPDILGFYILHEGLLGVFDETLKEVDYDDLEPGKPIRQETTGGWLGITDKYWLVALIPNQDATVETSFNVGAREGLDKYQADFRAPAVEVPAGGSAEVTNRLFAGAKEVRLLDRYEREAGIPRFDLAVDFGWFYFLTKPIFYAIDWLYVALGNFGLAILALTVVIKLIFFPLANKSYRAMSKMKLLQPKIVEMRERFGDDRMRLNQEMMALYKREKVNPAAGCLPILVQIPVFFALYKVLFVTLEMRHAPFFGWIEDLSAPDPLGILTLFGLVAWNVPPMLEIVNIGIWPILMGLTMYLQQKLNPPPPDPTQARIMMMLPFLFTFLLAKFPAGLVIYWTWNNLLSIAQQWVIMRGVQRASS